MLKPANALTRQDTPPTEMTRREFMTNLAAMAVLGGVLHTILDGKPLYRFDLEQEIASGDIDKYSSSAYGKDKEESYKQLMDAISSQDTDAIALQLKRKWAQNPDDEDRAVIAKAMAYTLTQDFPLKEKVLQTILSAAPSARDVMYVTRKNVPRGHDGPDVKTFAMVAGEGYEVPERKIGWVIKRDLDLGYRLEDYISNLPEISQGKSR